MPSKSTHGSPPSNAGPDLLERRSITGIFVHLLALSTGGVGAGIVYVVSTNEFTRRNARNALDWHLTMLALTVLTFGSLFAVAALTGQGDTAVAVLPWPADSLAALLASGLVTLWMAAGLWSFVVAFVATGKAIFGGEWRYPLSLSLVDRICPLVDLDGGWSIVVTAYALAAPVVLGVVLLGPRDGLFVLAGAFGMVGLVMVATPLAIAAMVIHGDRDRPADAEWRPNVPAYVGVPVAIGAIGYVLSGSVTESIYPAGDAMYAFLAAFWLSSVAYAVRRRTGERH